MKIAETLFKKVLEKGVIDKKSKLSEAIYKIRIKSDHIQNIDFLPGYFLRLGVGIDMDNVSIKDKIRSYSVWQIDKKNSTIDLAVATHSDGVGTHWAKKCKVGDEVFFKWKKGKFLIDTSADSYLMIGLSALSHLYVINRSLPSDKQIHGIVYSQNKNDLFSDIDDQKPFRFYELPQNPHEEITNKIKEIVSKMEGTKMAYIAGDSRLCVVLSTYFKKDLGWQSKQIKIKPFWNPIKKGLE